MGDGIDAPVAAGTKLATEEFAGATRLPGAHRQEIVPAIAGAAAAPTTYNATTASSTAVASNGLRIACHIYNNSDTTVWFAFGQAAVVGSGIPVLAGGRIVVDASWQGDIRVIHGATGNKALSIQELSA